MDGWMNEWMDRLSGGLRRGQLPPRCLDVRKNAAKVPSWMPLWQKKHDEVPSRVPFQWTKYVKVHNDFLRPGAPPNTTGALFTFFAPARQTSWVCPWMDGWMDGRMDNYRSPHLSVSFLNLNNAPRNAYIFVMLKNRYAYEFLFCCNMRQRDYFISCERLKILRLNQTLTRRVEMNIFCSGRDGGVMTRERQIKARRKRLLRKRRSGVEEQDGCWKMRVGRHQREKQGKEGEIERGRRERVREGKRESRKKAIVRVTCVGVVLRVYKPAA